MVNIISKLIIDIPTRVSLIPVKQPCKQVTISKDDVIEWVAGKSERIKNDEMDEFINDTAEFVRVLGVNLIETLVRKRKSYDSNPVFFTIYRYYKKWGAFTRSKENKITLLDLCLSCYAVNMSLNIWSHSDMLNNLKAHLDPDKHVIYRNQNKIKSWYAGFVHLNDMDWLWLPETEVVRYTKHSPYYLRIKQPSKKIYDEEYRGNNEKLNKYIKDEVIASISRYMSSQRDTVIRSVEFNGGYFLFKLIVSNRLLAYLIYTLPELLREEIRMCECGCGETVIGNRKYLSGHNEKKRNVRPDRKLKAWIRTKKNRGHITQEQYETYSDIVDREYYKGVSEEVIRDKIQSLIEEGYNHGQHREKE